LNKIWKIRQKNRLKNRKYRLMILFCADQASILASILIASDFPRAAQGCAGGLWKSANEDFPDVGGRGIDTLAPRSLFEGPHG
jgi:hypothetical protein